MHRLKPDTTAKCFVLDIFLCKSVLKSLLSFGLIWEFGNSSLEHLLWMTHCFKTNTYLLWTRQITLSLKISRSNLPCSFSFANNGLLILIHYVYATSSLKKKDLIINSSQLYYNNITTTRCIAHSQEGQSSE